MMNTYLVFFGRIIIAEFVSFYFLYMDGTIEEGRLDRYRCKTSLIVNCYRNEQREE